MANRPERILVVEDDAFFRSLLVRQLNGDGYWNIATTDNGHDAIDLLRANDIDLLLLDIEIPGIDGIGILKQLKEDARLESIPVIVISGVEDTPSVARCIELGADDYLSKPFNPVILRARIGASLEKQRLRKLDAIRLAQILDEQKRSDALLNVILPANAAQELKQTGTVVPRRHECVAVLFCDIVGFTAYCEKHEAEQVLSRLQALIERFEELTELHKMEKIKTIGDAFMAAAGILRPNQHPLDSAVQCGLDMIAATPEIAGDWQVRVGVECGALVSGVLGRQKYQFDIWGSVVNVASRMTELASPNTVAITQESWDKLAGNFHGRFCGERQIKGVGTTRVMECYFKHPMPSSAQARAITY